ncbi:DUF3244 domain-containing protein [uncultured Parabacteroides sp.]|uniref:DUF3244 domain-containing protein n=1 Tax=uncultured Parabacteroides sp. TaxID=512312 RepID=UPI0025F7DC87|nr:DUF3244 domain-containing protein [uncultured Parabacteroides sp.]
MKRMLALNRVLLLILGSMIFLVSQDAFAGSGKDEPKNIPLQGEWGEDMRSVSFEYPVSVSWDGTCLYVKSLSPRSTIHVTLSNGVENVCDETIQVGACLEVLYVGTLEFGETYHLVLTNQFGDRLEGFVFSNI